MIRFVRELYTRRQLLHVLVTSTLKKSTSGTALGALWWLLDPILMTMVYVILVQVIRGGQMKLPAYPVFVMSGLVAWKCTATCITAGIAKLSTSDRLIKSYNFPIAVLPLSSVLVNFFLFLVSLIPVLVFVLFYRYVMKETSVVVSWTVLLLPVVLIPHLMIAVGLTLLLSSAAVFVKDIANAMGHVLRIGWYFSGGLYTIEMAINEYDGLMNIEHWSVRHLLILNPFTHLLDVYRDLLIYGRTPDWAAVGFLFIFGLICLVLGDRVFQTYQHKFAKVL